MAHIFRVKKEMNYLRGINARWDHCWSRGLADLFLTEGWKSLQGGGGDRESLFDGFSSLGIQCGGC